MIRVKICGITTVRDAIAAADLGASAIGLVFWPSSPRCVDIRTARQIVESLPPFVSAVGVFVNQLESAGGIASEVGLSAVQLHGDERPEDYWQFPLHVIKAVPVSDDSTRTAAISVPPHMSVLLDAHDPVKRGGTGRRVDWTIAAVIARQRRIILSGGLNAANVAEAIAAVKPYALDISSGVESAPGRKDRGKLRELFDVLRDSPFDIQHSAFGIDDYDN
ncbi:MAG TPA: phosphoribosylanthranilate isomerase [Vicinamibacterales bacterium]|nr:phosphoribosylanthranilate isomerase [Vicinamibacterales bacterium]